MCGVQDKWCCVCLKYQEGRCLLDKKTAPSALRAMNLTTTNWEVLGLLKGLFPSLFSVKFFWDVKMHFGGHLQANEVSLTTDVQLFIKFLSSPAPGAVGFPPSQISVCLSIGEATPLRLSRNTPELKWGSAGNPRYLNPWDKEYFFIKIPL